MKILLFLLLSITATAQTIQYNVYEFDSKAEYLQVVEQNGYMITNPDKEDYQLIDTITNDKLDVHYYGEIITNYPATDTTWQPVYSTKIYVLSAKQGSNKLPSRYKVKGKSRKYIYNYIARFAGEKDLY